MTASLKIMSSMATKEFVARICQQYTDASGQAVATEIAGGVDINKRVRTGESVDVVMLAAKAIDELITDDGITPEEAKRLRSLGVKVTVAKAQA